MRRGPTFQDYYIGIDRAVRGRLEQERAEYLLSVDPDEYLDYLVGKAEWQPLEWHEDQMTVEVIMVGHAQKLRLRIPTTPHPQLQEYLKLGPSRFRLVSEPEWTLEKDALVLDVEPSTQAVDSALDDVRFWLGGRNNDIDTGNKMLLGRIEPIWRAKRQALEATHGRVQEVLRELNIPLHQDPTAKAKPVEIKPRKLRTVIAKPSPVTTPVPTLNRDDVLGLEDFVDQYARQFEVTPNTFARFEEEELRDLLVGMINVNYPGSATGETFSKLGKTDISLRVEGGHVLICECKNWKGAKKYGEALDQLFGYLTWRQNYGVLISFCKLLDMTKALDAAKLVIQVHPTFTPGTLSVRSETRFTSRHRHPQDADRSVEVHHLFFDLST
jgi:hypothetical protein